MFVISDLYPTSASNNLEVIIKEAGGGARAQLFAFSMQSPLSKWLPNSWATYSANTNKQGGTTHQAGIDNNLNYHVQQSMGGYAVVPHMSTYHKNRIALDTQTLGDDVGVFEWSAGEWSCAGEMGLDGKQMG